MCMKIVKIDIVRINEGFGGYLRNDASLDFAIKMQENNRLGIYKKLAYLWRAILVDHPFSDGNKRTMMYISLEFANEYNKTVYNDLLTHHIHSVASKNISEILNIERRIKNAIH